MATTLLASRNVLLGGDPSPWRLVPAAIELSGETIVAVDETAPGAAPLDLARLGAERGATLHDYGARALTPALVNGHTHLALSFLRGGALSRPIGDLVTDLYFAHERHLGAEDVRAFARIGAYESLLSGVGLVWDHDYHGEAHADALRDVGLAGVVAPTLQDLAGPGMAEHEDALAATEHMAHDRRLAACGVFAAVGPHATDTVSAGLWRRAAELAAREQLPLHAHAAQSFAEVASTSARTGSSPVEWLLAQGVLEQAPSVVLAHLLFARAGELAALARLSVTAAFCPYSQRHFAFPADPRAFDQHGLRWLVATDCAAGNDSLNLQKELRAAAEAGASAVAYGDAVQGLRRAGGVAAARAVDQARRDAVPTPPDPAGLLRRVTSLPGALHPACRAGTIAPGALANLVVWDLEHPCFWPSTDVAGLVRTLVFGDTTQAVHTMWVAGRRLGTEGDFHRSLVTSELYRVARRAADARLRALIARVG